MRSKSRAPRRKPSKAILPERPLNLEYRSPAELKVMPGHARVMPARQLKKVMRSIRELGFLTSILVDNEGCIICGHVRLEAAKRLGLTSVPTVCVSGMTPAQKAAYRIAENKLGDLGEWDDEALAAAFQNLLEEGFDVELTGFDTGEIDAALAKLYGQSECVVEPTPVGADIVSRLGDLWNVGRHRIFCGDSSDPASFERLLGDEKAQMVFTDPPYNVPISGNVAGIRKKTTPRSFKMAAGEMTQEQYSAFLAGATANIVSACEPGALLFVCIDWKHYEDVVAAARFSSLEQKQLIVWAKTNAGMGSFYKSQHELIPVFAVPGEKHINNFGLGRKGRNRTNVWTYAGANGFREGRSEDLQSHPTVKPTPLVADAIRDCSKRGGIVLDAFLGSGTTAVAAERTGRRGYGIELDPAFVDVALGRLAREVGEEPTLEGGLTYSQVAAERLREAA